MDYIQVLKEYLTKIGFNFSQTGFIWFVFHVCVLVVLGFISHYLANRITPFLRAQIRKIQGRPKLLRFLVSITKRSAELIFCLLLYIVITLLSEFTWPSHAYILTLVLWLVLAWVLLDIISKGIRNNILSKLFVIIVWSLLALNILQLLPGAISFLDSVTFSLGEQSLSLLEIFKGLILFSLAIWAAMVLAKFLSKRLDKSDDLSPSVKVLFAKLIKALFIIVAVLVSLNFIGIDFTTLAVFSGAIGIGLGFGLQKIAANLISGFILLMDKSIKPGDVISVGNTFGFINSLSARYVSVVARDGREYLIPNEELITTQVVNWSHTNELVRIDLDFGTSYDSDPLLVRKLACDAAKQHKRVENINQPVCHIIEFADSCVQFKLRFWISDAYNGITNVKGDIYLLLWQAFKDNNIVIPFPQREVRILPEVKRHGTETEHGA